MLLFKKLSLGLICFIAGIYVLNAAVIYFTQPVTLQRGAEEQELTKIGTNSIVGVEHLKSGGIGLWSRDTLGYVNVLRPEPIIYVNSTQLKDQIIGTGDYLYRHEFAHVMQKELVAEAAGGYPSYWNPVLSVTYYYQLLRLNAELSELMPELREEERAVPFPGLESAADCYAQPYSSPEEPAYFRASYLYPDYCDAEQKKITVRMFVGGWPEPLSALEKAALTPTNILEPEIEEVFSAELLELFTEGIIEISKHSVPR